MEANGFINTAFPGEKGNLNTSYLFYAQLRKNRDSAAIVERAGDYTQGSWL